MRPVAERAIDPAGLDDAFAHRIHLVEGAGRARGEQGNVAHLVGGGYFLRGRPVIHHLVVVPLHEDRHLGVEGAHVVVEEIILVRRAEFVERLGDLCLLGNRDVLPDLAVGELHLGGDDAVGIDGVAGMQQEIRPVLLHGGESDHAAIVGIDAPALARDIAAPDKADIAPVGRRGAEAADHGLARNVGMRKVAKPDPIEDVLSGGKIFQQHFRGEIALGQCRDRRQKPRIVEGFRGGDLDHHLRGTVGTRPHHAAIGADVAGLHAVADLRPVGGAAEIGHRDGAERAGACRRRGGKETPARKSRGGVARNPDRHAGLLDLPAG